MKKLTLLLILSLNLFAQNKIDKIEKKINEVTTSFSNASTKAKDYVVDGVNYADTSRVSKMLFHKVTQAVESIAVGLKTTASEVFKLYSMKIRIDGIVGLIQIVLLLMVCFYLLKKLNNTSFNDDSLFAITIIRLIALGLCIGFIYNNKQDALQKTIIPEYYVIQEVIKETKELIK